MDKIEHHVQINGIEVAARYSERAVNGIFIPFLRKLTEMQEAAGRRILVMLAAPPGAGKSTWSITGKSPRVRYAAAFAAKHPSIYFQMLSVDILYICMLK